MSGIYIPGLSVPENKAIAVVIHPDGTAYTAKMFAGVCAEYLKDCVAIPVPDHGRLIEAERLKEVFHRNVASGEAFDQLIDIAPTIIPADKEGEG